MPKGNSVGSDCHDEPRLYPGKLEAARQHRNDHYPGDGVEHGIEALNRPARNWGAPPSPVFAKFLQTQGLACRTTVRMSRSKGKSPLIRAGFFTSPSRIADSWHSFCKSSFHRLSFGVGSSLRQCYRYDSGSDQNRATYHYLPLDIHRKTDRSDCRVIQTLLFS